MQKEINYRKGEGLPLVRTALLTPLSPRFKWSNLKIFINNEIWE